jgi:hypothetical protein
MMSSVIIPRQNRVYCNSKNNLHNALEWEELYGEFQIDKPSIDLKSGKHIVLYGRSNCSKTITMAYKLSIISKRNPHISVFFMLENLEAQPQLFEQITKSNHIPSLYTWRYRFPLHEGTTTPIVHFLQDGFIDTEYDGVCFEEKEILLWYNF